MVNNAVCGGVGGVGYDAGIMGSAAIHQFVRIGHAALVGGVAGVEADVIPYGSVLGNRARLIGLHWIWLRRNGVQSHDIHDMRRAFLTLYPKNGGDAPFAARPEAVRPGFSPNVRIPEILAFIDAPRRRGLVRPGRGDASGLGIAGA